MMRARLLLLAVAVTLAQGQAKDALASFNTSGAGTSGARAAVLAPPTGLTVTGQSCTPTASGETTIGYRDGSINTSNSSTVSVTRPGATVAGDLLIAAYTIRDDAAGIISAPAGWTQVRVDAYATKSLQTGIWYHTAAADDPSLWTWTSTGTNASAIGAITAYSGASGVNTSSGGSQTGIYVIAPSVTPSVPGTRLVGVFSEASNATMSTPAGMTTRVLASLGNKARLQVAGEGLYNTSPTGLRAAVLASSQVNMGQLVVLTPTVAPTTSTVSYVGDTENAGTTSFTVAAPAGIQVGDLMLIGYGKRTTAPTVTTPAGWTLLRRDLYSPTDYQQIVYYRVATSADTAGTTYALTSSNADKADAILVAFRGVDQASPIVTSGGGANAGDSFVTAPSVTPSRADTRLVGFFGSSDGRTVAANAAGMTSRQYVATGAGGLTDVELEVEDEPWPSAGTATGTRTIALNGPGRAVAQLVALKAESYPLAALSWTASTASYADGYRLGRVVGGTETVVTQLGTSPTSYTVGNTNRLTGGSSYTMNLKTRASNWLSTAESVTFPALATC